MTTYAYPNFKSKKALKEAIAAGQEVIFEGQGMDPSWNKDYSKFTGTECVCGPHYPEPHKWYSEVTFVNGKVTKVK
jgi:hypothetical protein